MLTDTVLPSNVEIRVDVFSLIAFVFLPFPVVVAAGNGKTEMPAVQPAVVLAIAQPETSLYAQVEELGGMGIVGPDPPGCKYFAFKAPAIVIAERKLHFQVGCNNAPECEIGL